MKKAFLIPAILSVALASIWACENDDNQNNRPTATEMRTATETALNGMTQHFQFTAGTGLVTFTSAHGVTIAFNSNGLTYNGNPVTGNVVLNFIEIFDKGSMALTYKPTRGRNNNGDLAMLLSGGEFFINAVQDGHQLDIEGLVSLDVPEDDPNLINDGMGLWQPIENDSVSAQAVVWDPANDVNIGAGVIATGNGYFCTFANFGWCNIDMFYADPRPKTTILARAPQGYTDQNCRIYLSYDGYGHSLANLDTYTQDGYFSEHYGQIPIGMACHAIFLSVENDGYRYAIKPITIAAGGIINFDFSETTTGTSAETVAAINAVQ